MSLKGKSQKYAGLKRTPKDICKDRDIGTWKGQNAGG